MTLSEYFLRMEASALQRSDQKELIHLQAWANQTVQATSGSPKHPKPKYKGFKDFYDADTNEKKIINQYEGNKSPEEKAKRKRIEIGRQIDQKLAERRKTQSNNIQLRPF